MQINAVHQRARGASPVASDRIRRAAAYGLPAPGVTAGAWVQCGHQLELRGVAMLVSRAAHPNLSAFERLSESTQHRPGEFSQLVEKEYAALRHGNFYRCGFCGATHECRDAAGMMRLL